MKITKSELIESIKALNEKKPLKESADIQRVLFPADADAQEQHEEALKANKERLDPKNYSEDVKDLVKMTASEESRYAHFDVVNRKDLAKQINEAKAKGLPFRVSRNTKEGFRYNLDVLKEEFLKKDAGNPDINTAAFNKATDVGNGPIAEEYKIATEDTPEYINALAKAFKALNESEKAAGVIYGYVKDNKFVPFFAIRESEDELANVRNSLRSKQHGIEDVMVYTLFPRQLSDVADILKEKGALPKLNKERVVEDLDDSPEAKEVWDKLEEKPENDLPEDFAGKIEFLTADEEEAIEGYDKVIEALTGDEFASAKAQLEIIRDEEVAHKEFLEKLMADPTAIYGGVVDENEIEVEEGDEELEDEKEEKPLTEDLDEELKVFTSTLSGFHPSEQAEEIWNEIKDANKVEDLERALELLYPDGLSDVAFDDLLIHEPDWIRDMIGLNEPDEETEEEPIDEFEDEEIEPVDDGEKSDDDWTEEPVDESEDEIKKPIDDVSDEPEETKLEDEETADGDLGDEEPIDIDDTDLEEKEPVEETLEAEKPCVECAEEEKAEKEHPLDESFCKECDDEQTAKLADGFINNQFKQNEISEESEAAPKNEIAETLSDTDDEVVAVDDSSVEEMLGMPKSEKK